MKKNNLGREKAKQNSFIRKSSRPEDYSPNLTKLWLNIEHCELCGQSISYSFLLEHKSDKSKNMLVGSDCIIKFSETYLPNIVSSMLRHMELTMSDMIEKKKTEDFKTENPDFYNDIQA